MKIKIAMLLTIGVLLSAASYAQKVTVVDGVAKIDCTGMRGISKQKKGFVNTSTDKISSGVTSEYTSDAADQQIYYKFEVTSANVGNGTKSWVGALDICRGHDDGTWRLPTHRELALILVLNPELNKEGKGSYTPLDINISYAYWSATDSGGDDVWTVGTFIGLAKKTKSGDTNPPNRIRCIKELE